MTFGLGKSEGHRTWRPGALAEQLRDEEVSQVVKGAANSSTLSKSRARGGSDSLAIALDLRTDPRLAFGNYDQQFCNLLRRVGLLVCMHRLRRHIIQTHWNATTPAHAARAGRCSRHLVLAAPPPNTTAVEVGRLEASTGARGPGSEAAQELLAQLRKVAGENGCDSILPGPPEESLAATSSGTPMYETTQTAVCFVNR